MDVTYVRASLRLIEQSVLASIEEKTEIKPVPISHANQQGVAFMLSLDQVLSETELRTVAARTRAIVENATSGGDPGREKQKTVMRLRHQERKLIENIKVCEKNRAYWQKKYDESISSDPNKLPNFQALHYANKWESDARHAENLLSIVQEQIAEWESM